MLSIETHWSRSTLRTLCSSLSSSQGVSALTFSYSSRYSARILNLNSYGCSGSIFYSSPSSPVFSGSSGMYGCRQMMQAVLRRLTINSYSPFTVMKILSAMKSEWTSRSLASCTMHLLMFFWASEKFVSTSEEVMKQKIPRSSGMWLARILLRIPVLGASRVSQSITLILPSASLALNRLYKALSLILEFRGNEYTLGLAPWAFPPFRRWGARLSPILALPLFFWPLILAPEPAVMPRVLVVWDRNLFRLLRYMCRRQMRSLRRGWLNIYAGKSTAFWRYQLDWKPKSGTRRSPVASKGGSDHQFWRSCWWDLRAMVGRAGEAWSWRVKGVRQWARAVVKEALLLVIIIRVIISATIRLYSRMSQQFTKSMEHEKTSVELLEEGKIIRVDSESSRRVAYLEVTSKSFQCVQCLPLTPRLFREMIKSPHLGSYLKRRQFLFSKFDEGIQYDEESLYSIIPESVSLYLKHRFKNSGIRKICEPFSGVGGVAVHLCDAFQEYIVNDFDPSKIKKLKKNLKVYDKSPHLLKYYEMDFLALPSFATDALIICPPWGSINVSKYSNSNLDDIMKPKLSHIINHALLFSSNILLQMPKTTNIGNFIETYLSCPNSPPLLTVQKILRNGKVEQLFIYIGSPKFTGINIHVNECIYRDLGLVGNHFKSARKKVKQELKHDPVGVVSRIYDMVSPAEVETNQSEPVLDPEDP